MRRTRARRLIAGLAALVFAGLVLTRAQTPPPVEVQQATVTTADGVELDTARYALQDPGGPKPALLLAHGFGSDRTALDAAAKAWAREGLVVVTWSARGFGRSGGQIGLADPAREIADVTLLLDLLATDVGVEQDGPDDPRAAIAGGSYGGGTALLAAIDDPRLDAIAAVAAWNDLGRSLAPGGVDGEGVWKAQWASLLFTSGTLSSRDPGAALDALGVQLPGRTIGVGDVNRALCGRFDPQVCRAYAQSAEEGTLTAQAVELARRASPQGQLDEVATPTLLVHALGDDLFGPEESLHNAAELRAAGAPVTVRWIEGGHGGLAGPDSAAGRHVAPWLLRVLGGAAPGDDPPFAWRDGVSGQDVAEDTIPNIEGIASASDTQVSRPDSSDEAAARFLLTREGDLRPVTPTTSTEPAGGSAAGESLAMVRPAGALPASLSTLPGFGALAGFGGLLPPLDIPGQALAFTSPALDEDLVIVGQPRLAVQLSAEAAEGTPMAVTVHAKLIDVTPGGQVQLIGATSSPIRMASAGRVDAPLGAVAHRVVAGNRLRLVLATTDQAYSADPRPSIVQVHLDAETGLRLPLGGDPDGPADSTALGLLAPVGLILLLGIAVALLVARDERRLGALIGSASSMLPTDGVSGDEDPVAVRVTGLVKAYADGKVAVDGLDLEVRRGQVFGLLGPNGAGKTTTMRMLLGLILPTSGTVELLGTTITPGHPVLRRVGVIVEGPGFAPHLTGRQNLVSTWRSGGRPLHEANIDRAIDVADLGPAIDRGVRTYSHGMKQRLAIAQALLGEPDLLILDEPTDGLDPEQIRAVRELLARLGDEGLTILVSSHLLSEVEQMCTHAAVMQQGRVIASGAVTELVGGTRSIVIRTDDRNRARQAVIGTYGVAAVADEADGLAIDLESAAVQAAGNVEAADVVALLVASGLRVQSVTPRGQLEDAFLALTGAGATRRAEQARDVQRRGDDT